MPWVRFADDYLGNAKLVVLSTSAIALDVAGIIYSAREVRDGHLSLSDVQVIAALIHLRRWEHATSELVAARRWMAVREPIGWDIHDYLEYQPSREQVLAERQEKHAAKVAAGHLGGVASAQARAQANGKQNGSKTEAEGQANAKQKASPVPGPGINSRPPARLAGRSAPAGAREPADFQPLGDLLAADLPDEVLERLGRPPIGQPAKPASPSIPSQETPGAVG